MVPCVISKDEYIFYQPSKCDNGFLCEINSLFVLKENVCEVILHTKIRQLHIVTFSIYLREAMSKFLGVVP